MPAGTWRSTNRTNRYGLRLPLGPVLDTASHYPNGSDKQWKEIAANLEVVVKELSEDFLPEFEEIARFTPK